LNTFQTIFEDKESVLLTQVRRFLGYIPSKTKENKKLFLFNSYSIFLLLKCYAVSKALFLGDKSNAISV